MEEGAFVTEKGRENSCQNEGKSKELEAALYDPRQESRNPHEENDWEKIFEHRICNMEEYQQPQLPPDYMTKAKFSEFKT